MRIAVGDLDSVRPDGPGRATGPPRRTPNAARTAASATSVALRTVTRGSSSAHVTAEGTVVAAVSPTLRHRRWAR